MVGAGLAPALACGQTPTLQRCGLAPALAQRWPDWTLQMSDWRYGVAAARSDAESSMTCCSWPLRLTWKAP